MIKITAALACAFCLANAQAELPPRDLAASPWLNAIAPRLYRQGRAVMLVRDCLQGAGADQALTLFFNFNSAVKTLGPADYAYAYRVFNAGGEAGNDDLKADKAKACAGFSPAQIEEAQRLATGRQGFWDAPDIPASPAGRNDARAPQTAPSRPVVIPQLPWANELPENTSPAPRRLQQQLSSPPG